MHEQPSAGRVVHGGSDSRDLPPIVLQNLLHGVLFAIERGFTCVERDFEHAGRREDCLCGVSDVFSGEKDLGHAGGPNGSFTVDHQVVDAALCDNQPTF